MPIKFETQPFEIGDKITCIETDTEAMFNSSNGETLVKYRTYTVKSCEEDDWQESGWNVIVKGLETDWDASSFEKYKK